MRNIRQLSLIDSYRGWFALLLLLTSTLTWAEKPLAPDTIPGILTVDAEQTIELVLNNPDLIVVDARLPEEFLKGHIEGAVSLVDSAVNEKTLGQILKSKTTPALFYCNGPRCLRSSRAAKKALSSGYTNLYWFRDGWAGWIEKELPVAH
ncbi:MAG: rhodanese-like domain-containing protein [Gammaproteobacteria bacterium]|nr:rhodanese-like domain-containing protein [Gammaproteobacteria bacterium]